VDRTEEALRTTPRGVHGLVAAVVVNAGVAVAFDVALAHQHGLRGLGGLAYHYDKWLLPVCLFLVITLVAGVVASLVRGWRWFGVGLVSGALLVGLLDLVWTLGYLVSLGS